MLVACALLSCSPAGNRGPSAKGPSVFGDTEEGRRVAGVWGVFVGISEYEDAELNLNFADRDATELHAFFTTHFAGKVPADHFTLLTNSDASRGEILSALHEVMGRAFEEDLVIVALSMHGLPDRMGAGLYFLAHDTDPNKLWDKGISQDEILKFMSHSRARRIVLFLDSCNSGGFGAAGSLVTTKNVKAADTNRLLMALAEVHDGVAVFTSSSAAERSRESRGYCGGHGAFTCALLQGLRGRADQDRDGLIRVRELFDFIYRRVKDATFGLQHPAVDGRFDNDLPLACVASSPGAMKDGEERLSNSATLVVKGTPTDADVSIWAGGRVVASGVLEMTAEELAAGTYSVRANRDGYTEHVGNVQLRAGERQVLAIRLEPLPMVDGASSATCEGKSDPRCRFLRAGELLSHASRARAIGDSVARRRLYSKAGDELLKLEKEAPDFEKADVALWEAARAFEQADRLGKANDIYRRLLADRRFSRSPNRRQFLKGLAGNYDKLFDFPRAAQTYLEQAQQFPGDDGAEEAVDRAAALQGMAGKYLEAAEALEGYVEKHPTGKRSTELAFKAIEWLEKAGVPERVETSARRFLKRAGTKSNLAGLLASCHLKLGGTGTRHCEYAVSPGPAAR